MFIILILLSNCFYYIKAQNIISRLSGTIIDSVQNTPIPYVQIFLFNTNDSIVSVALSNEKGNFFFQSIHYTKDLYLLIHGINYEEKRIDLPYIENITHSKLDFDSLLLQPKINQLGSIGISYKQDYIEQKFDRTIFNISEDKAAAAITILDLLRTLPGVVVDEEGNIRYKGGAPTIYVDNILMKYRYAKIEMIPVHQVEKIELVDNMMQTGEDGTGGIINILLKTINKDGLSGMISITSGTIRFKYLGASNLFLNLNYKYKRCTFFLNSTFDYAPSNELIYTQSTVRSNNDTVFQSSDFNQSFQQFFTSTYAGVVYNPTSKTRLQASTFIIYAPSKASYVDNLYNYSVQRPDSSLYQWTDNSINQSTQLLTGLTLSFYHKFDTLDTYIRGLMGFTYVHQFSNTFSTYHYNQINSTLTDSTYIFNNTSNAYFKYPWLRVTYNHSINKNLRLNLSYSLYVYVNSTQNMHHVDNTLILPQSQFAHYINHSHSVPLRIGGKINKWTLDGGINFIADCYDGTYLRYQLDDQDTSFFFKKNYIKVLPSLLVGYNFNNNSMIKLSFDKRANMPYFRLLTDYIDKKNPYQWYSGNSKLKPVDVYSFYFSYNYNKEKFNLSTECFFNYTNNQFVTIAIPISSLISLNRPENLYQQTNLGIDASLWFSVKSIINFSLSGNLFHNLFNIDTLNNLVKQYNLSENDYKRRQLGYYAKFSTEMNFKGFNMMLYISYYGKEITFNGYKNGYMSSSFNISKKFLDNKLRVTLGLNRIFDDLLPHKSFSDMFGITSRVTSRGTYYERYYYLTLQYNIGQGERGTKNLK